MPNQYLIRNFLGAPNSASIKSTKMNGLHEDKSPAKITLTDKDGGLCLVEVIRTHDFDDNVVPKIQLRYENRFGSYYLFFSHESQKLTVNKKKQHFTLSYNQLDAHTQDVEDTENFKLFRVTQIFPSNEYDTFIKWKRHHVDNVPELKDIIDIS